VSENPIVLICLVVIPCTYALAPGALVRAEYRQPRQVIKGRDIVVATDARTTVVGTDPPRMVAKAQGVMLAELASPGRRPVDGSPIWQTLPAAQLPRGRRR
jgi:hypothetical protein